MPRVLAFTNNKGGTGKSTLCANCAFITARLGFRVLLVDLTSQRTASTLLLGEVDDLPESDTVLAALAAHPQKHLEDLVFEGDKGVDVIPSHVLMAKAVVQLMEVQTGKEHILQRELERLQADYDYIFLDSPGDLNILTANVLVPSHAVLIPSRLNRTDFSCTETTLQFVRQASGYIGQRTARVVLNMLDDRYLPSGIWAQSHTGQLYQQALQVFGDFLSPVTIPDSSDLRTAFDRGLTLMEYKPEALTSQRLQALVKQEVLSEST